MEKTLKNNYESISLWELVFKKGPGYLIVFIGILYFYHYAYHNFFLMPALDKKLDKTEFQASIQRLESTLSNQILSIERRMIKSEKEIIEKLHKIDRGVIRLF